MDREEVITWAESTMLTSSEILNVFFDHKNEHEPNEAIHRLMNHLAQINNAAVVVASFFKYGFTSKNREIYEKRRELE